MATTVKKIGRYDVLRELGRGAMGVVYAAEDRLIGRAVAIKTIRFDTPEAGEDREQLIQRLHREAQAAGVLSHPGIVTVYDVGEQEDEAYIVMEFVDGKSAEDILASAEPLPPGKFLSILRGTAAAIDYAHGKGIIHRDIKPSNIMVCRDGTVKIADFGIAKLTASNSLTRSGFVVGTPSYMSPEQAQGRAVDGRSDQFSLAVVAFRMITGRLPFEGETLTALLTKILWDEPEYESTAMNPMIRPVFKRALSKDPQLRFPTCCAFVRGLEEAIAAIDPSLPAAIASMTPLGAASTGFNAALAGSDSAAALPLDASRYRPGTMPQPASWATPSRDMRGSAKSSQDARAPFAASENAAQTRKRKWLWISLAAGLGCIALVLFAMSVFKPGKKAAIVAQNENIGAVHGSSQSASDTASLSQLSGQVSNPQGTQAAQSSPLRPDLDVKAILPAPASGAPDPAGEGRKISVPAVSEQKPLKKATTRQPVPAKTVSEAAPPVETASSGSQKAEEPAAPPQSTSGVLTWSGELERNSILVILEQRSSVGSVVGQFPGKPIKVTVEPKGLAVRQLPGEANRWSQIILYSGNQRYSSISIHWSIIE